MSRLENCCAKAKVITSFEPVSMARVARRGQSRAVRTPARMLRGLTLATAAAARAFAAISRARRSTTSRTAFEPPRTPRELSDEATLRYGRCQRGVCVL